MNPKVCKSGPQLPRNPLLAANDGRPFSSSFDNLLKSPSPPLFETEWRKSESIKVDSDDPILTATRSVINQGNLDLSNDPRLVLDEYFGNFEEELDPRATEPVAIIFYEFLLSVKKNT